MGNAYIVVGADGLEQIVDEDELVGDSAASLALSDPSAPLPLTDHLYAPVAVDLYYGGGADPRGPFNKMTYPGSGGGLVNKGVRQVTEVLIYGGRRQDSVAGISAFDFTSTRGYVVIMSANLQLLQPRDIAGVLVRGGSRQTRQQSANAAQSAAFRAPQGAWQRLRRLFGGRRGM